MNSKIDPEIFATINSAQALSRFSHYIRSLDERLTLAEATAAAAAVIDALPHFFIANPNLLNHFKKLIAEVIKENSDSQ